MSVVIITGSGGLIGSESVKFFSDKFDIVIGIDNNFRKLFFGDDASTQWCTNSLLSNVHNFKYINADICDTKIIEKIFAEYNNDIKLVIHAAAQPSHDWAATNPYLDFQVNAVGTQILLESTRRFASNAVFIYCSTNKVYGDNPNRLPLIENDTRWELIEDHKYYQNGIDEKMSIDNTMHSLFGASKLAADILVQEYGKYFNIKTVVFRGGCLTGQQHSGTHLHGFLSFLVKSALLKQSYKILGHKGKQVRDNIHSYDLITMFWEFYKNPKSGEIYNAGGSRFSNCSIVEAIDIINKNTNSQMILSYDDTPRRGDHIWYISDVTKFKKDYPNWNYSLSLQDIILQMLISLDKKL